LGKEAGVAAEAVNKLAADGQISSAMLEAAIQKNIGGAAKTMGESFSGSVANAQAALGRLGEAFLKPVFNQAPGGISSITEALDGMTGWINNNQGTIVTFWANIAQAAVTTAQAVMQAVGEMTMAFGQLVGGIGNLEGSLLKIQSAGARLAGDTEGADKLLADADLPLVLLSISEWAHVALKSLVPVKFGTTFRLEKNAKVHWVCMLLGFSWWGSVPLCFVFLIVVSCGCHYF
jgi:hypothetical protein